MPDNRTAFAVYLSLFHLIVLLNLTIGGLPSAVIDYGGQSYWQPSDEHVDIVDSQHRYQCNSQQLWFLLFDFFAFDLVYVSVYRLDKSLFINARLCVLYPVKGRG